MKTILFVDDEQVILNALKRAFLDDAMYILFFTKSEAVALETMK